MVRNKVRKKKTGSKSTLQTSLSLTSQSTQGWESTGFQAQVDWISVLTGPEKDWKRSVTLQTSIILPIFGPNRGPLWPIWRTRSQRREKPASKCGQVGVSLPSSWLATFFSVWWRLWRPNFFQRRLSTTSAQRAFQDGVLATRISKRRDFLTCRSSSTGPSSFLATPSLPRYANPDNNC